MNFPRLAITWFLAVGIISAHTQNQNVEQVVRNRDEVKVKLYLDSLKPTATPQATDTPDKNVTPTNTATATPTATPTVKGG